MAEQKAKKRKPGTVRRILKWIGLGLLALLLIAALIFQAPWKVITLLLIILLACTILPRPARKWFWFSVGAVVIALIIWVFLPDETKGWRPYTFDEELAAIEAKRAIPDSENAATIYNQLLDNYDANTFEPNFIDDDCYDLTLSEPWLSEDYPELAKWLKGHQTTIETLIEASKIENCCFPIAAEAFEFNKLGDRLSPMRHWTFLLIRAANNDLGEDRIDQGLEKQIAVLQMAKHTCQQPTMIEWLVGIALEALAVQQFNGFIITGDATEAHLDVIEKALSEIKHDWSYDWLRMLECEKLMTKNTVCYLAYEINPKGKIRRSCRPTAAMRAQFPEAPALTYWQKKLYKTGTILGWFYMPSTPRKAGEIIDAKYEKIYAMAEPDFDWQKEPRKFPIIRLRFNYRYLIEHLVGMPGKAYYRIHDVYLRVIAEQRGSQLLIALRRYKNKNGHWPESLDDIKSLVPAEIFVDPINGSSFVYKLTEKNFTLYSKGKNNIDEEGHYNTKWAPDYSWHKVEEDDILIWPPKSRKTKEKNTNAKQQ